MTSERCQTCQGRGWICERCKKPRGTPGSAYVLKYGKGCWCFGARAVRCPSHITTSHTCDACRRPMPTYGKPLRSIRVCDACEKDWEAWVAVAFDRWLAEPKAGR